MKTPAPPEYGGLTAIQGIGFDICSLSQPVSCPLCSSPDVAILDGRISLAAKMGDDIVIENLPLAAFVCPNSHVFFMREYDITVSDTGIAA